MYFNPRSYKRSDTYLPCLFATDHVFQSTLLQEERPLNLTTPLPCLYFNPRSYKRSDIQSQSTYFRCPCISIHAPTRGATKSVASLNEQIRISIHAPTRGATPGVFLIALEIPNFNPRSYKRSDLSYLAPGCADTNFNPRSYKRSDIGGNCKGQMRLISIHAPTRGATRILF